MGRTSTCMFEFIKKNIYVCQVRSSVLEEQPNVLGCWKFGFGKDSAQYSASSGGSKFGKLGFDPSIPEHSGPENLKKSRPKKNS